MSQVMHICALGLLYFIVICKNHVGLHLCVLYCITHLYFHELVVNVAVFEISITEVE